MDIRVLRYFLALCREGTISRAAHAEGVTQPTLSRQLSDLEKDMGCRLFERGPHRIELTEKGLYLRRRAEEIVALADRTENDLKAAEGLIEGDIRIGAGESQGIRALAGAIASFRGRHPQVRFRLHSGNAEDVVERLEKGLVDLAVLIDYSGIDRYDSLRLPQEDRWCLLMPEGHPLGRKDSITAADLVGEPLIVSDQAITRGALSTWLGRNRRRLDVAATYTLAFNGEMLVREGVGVMLSLERLARAGRGSGLEARPLHPALSAPIDIAWKRDQAKTLAVRTFLEEVEALAPAQRPPFED